MATLASPRVGVPVLAGEEYAIAGIYSFGRGFLHRPTIRGTETKYATLTKIENSDLVYSKLGAFEGAVGVVDEEATGRWVTPEFPVFALSEAVVPSFLRHYVSSEMFREQLAQSSTGVGARQKRVAPKAFLRLEVPVPPIDEQRRIAAHLDAVDRHSRVPPNRRAPEVERALLSALFDSDAHTRELGDLATVTRGVTPILQSGGPGIVGQASVRWDGIDVARLKGVDPSWESSRGPERRTQVGDLLLNSTGEGTIGRCGLVGSESVGLLTDSKVLTVRVGPNVLAEYLALYLRSPHGQAAIEAVKGANTTKQTELGVQRALRLRVPDPSTEEQRRVVSAWAAAAVPLEKFDRAERHRSELISSLLPAARNEIFTAMR
ncbi:restriction endonuclease subunit S [Janibacter hoylei]